MKYKFVEIGCSICNTYADRFGLEVNGLLVEPMPNLFKVVPSSNTVKKENVAISKHDGEVEFYLYNEFTLDNEYQYYGSEPIQNAKDVKKGWGASSIDLNPHPGRPVNSKVSIPCITLQTLFNKYNVTEVDYFKVDAEGHDDVILEQLLLMVNNKEITINKEIIFEYGYPVCNKTKLDKLSKIFETTYNFQRKTDGADIVLTKKL